MIAVATLRFDGMTILSCSTDFANIFGWDNAADAVGQSMCDRVRPDLADQHNDNVWDGFRSAVRQQPLPGDRVVVYYCTLDGDPIDATASARLINNTQLILEIQTGGN